MYLKNNLEEYFLVVDKDTKNLFLSFNRCLLFYEP